MSTTIENITDLRHEIEQLLYRAKFYNEPITSESLESLLRDSPEEENHENCIDQDSYAEVECERDELESEVEELKATIKKLENK